MNCITLQGSCRAYCLGFRLFWGLVVGTKYFGLPRHSGDTSKRVSNHAPVGADVHNTCTHGPVHLQANGSSSLLHPSSYLWLSTALAHWWLMIGAKCPKLVLFSPNLFWLLMPFTFEFVHIWVLCSVPLPSSICWKSRDASTDRNFRFWIFYGFSNI